MLRIRSREAVGESQRTRSRTLQEPCVTKASMQPLNVAEYEPLAKAAIDPGAWDYIAGGANDEITLSRNVAAFRRIDLLPRVLIDVTHVDATVTVLGHQIASPVMVAPIGFQSLAHPDGELAMVRGAAAASTITVVSTMSSYALEDIAAASTEPKWFQLYCYRDRNVTRRLVQRAQEAGFEALCVTVDLPMVGKRERDLRNAFQLPDHASPKNFIGMIEDDASAADLDFSEYMATLIDPSLTWELIPWLRSETSLPIVLKGIHHPADARLAIEYGADGIIVSNHGGRQLDTVPATIDMLPRVKDEVGEAIEVYLDGGIRRGTDIVKALALGARAVLVGRPPVWGLAVSGADGVQHVLGLLAEETKLALALLGAPTVGDLSRDHLAPARTDWRS